MKQYHIVSGIIADESLPTVQISEEGRVMGNIKNWAALFDADHTTSNNQILNRVNGENVEFSAGSFTKTMLNGKNVISTTSQPTVLSNFDLNPKSYTIFGIVRPNSMGSTNSHMLLTSKTLLDQGTNDVVVNFGLSQDAKTVFSSRRGAHASISSAGSRIQSSDTYDTKLNLIMLTFSEVLGLNLYVNGKLVATNSTDKRVASTEYKNSEFQLLRGFYGDMAVLGVVNADLTIQENDRKAIEEFYTAKYQLV